MYFRELVHMLKTQEILIAKVEEHDSNPQLSDITCHSSKIYPQSLFCCIAGRKWDGHDYAREALSKGAVAFLCERQLPLEAPQMVIPNLRKHLGKISEVFYDAPSKNLRLTGITGTNGKSSTAFIMRSIIHASGGKSGLLGTIEYSDGVHKEEAGRTTPEAPDLQRFFAKMRKHGCSDCVMEISSHAVMEGRIAGCDFNGLIFSNLTPEHLDYHGNMEAYFQAKRSIFTKHTRKNWHGALNSDDPYGARLYEEFFDFCASYGLESGNSKHHITLLSSTFHPEGTEVRLQGPQGQISQITLPLVGKFNLYNTLGAMTLASLYGIPWEDLILGVQQIPKIPGRMESYRTEKGVTCIIDYAHTPDALAKVLASLKYCCQGKLRVLFGSGGNRFPGNRPLMGIAAARYADDIIITMDNPRYEDPQIIAEENYQGVLQENAQIPCKIIVDRKEAIHHLLDSGEREDILVIAGKGPESYLEISGTRHAFSDKGALEEWALERGVSYR